jgi:hypothetical protein
MRNPRDLRARLPVQADLSSPQASLKESRVMSTMVFALLMIGGPVAAALIGLCLFLIYALDHPYRFPTGLDPSPFETEIEHVTHPALE